MQYFFEFFGLFFDLWVSQIVYKTPSPIQVFSYRRIGIVKTSYFVVSNFVISTEVSYSNITTGVRIIGVNIEDSIVVHCNIISNNKDSYIENDNLTIRVGPTEKNLENLRKKWIKWLEKHEDKISEEDPYFVTMSDSSIPNLSSIMLLIEADGKKLLFTGDGRGDYLLEGLEKLNLLDEEGKFHVDILKVPHHGSDLNVTKKFFKTVTADMYVISANGKDANPDLATLIWIVDATKKQQRRIKIFVTNETPSTQKLVENYPQDEFNYDLVIMDRKKSSEILKIT